MPIFRYEALDSQGVGIKDEIEALSEKEAISKIRNLGYFPTKVRVHGAGRKVAAAAARPARRRGAGGKVRVKYIAQFARQLSSQIYSPVCKTAFHAAGRRSAYTAFAAYPAGAAKVRNLQEGHRLCCR